MPHQIYINLLLCVAAFLCLHNRLMEINFPISNFPMVKA